MGLVKCRKTSLHGKCISCTFDSCLILFIYFSSQAMNLSQFALTQTTVGQLVNILSNDVARLDTATTFLHYLWIGPIQLGIVVAILWSYFDVACLSGICFLILFTPFQSKENIAASFGTPLIASAKCRR